MNTRPMRVEDIDALKLIHEKHFHEEFDLSEFDRKFISLFTVVGDEGEIVTLGGIRLIPEAVIVTDKTLTPRSRVEGLMQMLDAMRSVCKHHRLDALHAFVQDPNWLDQLQRVGFKETKGKSLYFNV